MSSLSDRKCRATNYEIFEFDCSFERIALEMYLRNTRSICYKQWQCRLVGFSNYCEIQFVCLNSSAVAPALASTDCYFNRPRGLAAVLCCDGTRLYWDGAVSANRSAYTRIQCPSEPENGMNQAENANTQATALGQVCVE